MSSVIEVTTVNYPESDGQPMGETDQYRDEMVRVIELLRRFFEGQRVYVSGNLLVYYRQGKPKKFVVPDAFVVKGLEPGPRRIYKLWVERRVPDAIVEVTSRKPKKKDTVSKPKLYRRLGVKEYGSLVSQELRLRLHAEEGHLVLYRLDTGQRLLTEKEARQAAEQACEAEATVRQAEAAARQAAEAEVARLREELRRRDGA